MEVVNPDPAADTLELHRAGLTRMAATIRKYRPELRLVGLLAEAGVPEAAALSKVQQDVLRGSDGSVAVLVTRDSAKSFLRQMAPRALDWLEDEGAEQVRLPVVQIGKLGIRTATLE